MITVTGGKWTTYRRMAEETVDAAVATGRLPLNTGPCRTLHLKLRGAEDFRPTLHAEVRRGCAATALLPPHPPASEAQRYILCDALIT